MAGFLELLLMNTSKHATCETAPVGAEAAMCCASHPSDRGQRQGQVEGAMGAAGPAAAAVAVAYGLACSSCFPS